MLQWHRWKHNQLSDSLRLSYEASSIGPSSSPSARLARISIRVRAKRDQSSAWATDSWRETQACGIKHRLDTFVWCRVHHTWTPTVAACKQSLLRMLGRIFYIHNTRVDINIILKIQFRASLKKKQPSHSFECSWSRGAVGAGLSQ